MVANEVKLLATQTSEAAGDIRNSIETIQGEISSVVEMIADITTTGATLDANHLKMLQDGPVLKSQATLFASRVADWKGAELGAVLAPLGIAVPSDMA